MSDTPDVRIIDMSLQGVPPGEFLQTTPNHQLTPEQIRSSLDLFLFGHTLLDAPAVQVGPLHPNTTAGPPSRLHPAIVSHDVAFEVGNSLVFLNVVASNDGALEVGFLVDQPGTIFTLEVTRRDTALVRVRTPVSARRSNALLGFGGRTSGRGGCATGRLVLGGGLALLLLLGRGCLSRTVLLVVVIGGKNVVGIALAIRFGAIAAGGRGG